MATMRDLLNESEPDWQALYMQLGRLLETMPDFSEYQNVHSREGQQWFARAGVLVAQVNVGADDTLYRIQTGLLATAGWKAAVRQLITFVYRAQATAESKVPAAMAGAFIPVGSSFDAFSAIAKIVQNATGNVLIVDPYLDETALTDFGLTIPSGVRVRLLADQKDHKPSLIPAAQRWVSQHGALRPIEVRLAPAKSLHDRAIFVDGSGAWTLTQSLKDFAKRSPAEIVRADDTAQLKIQAYEAIWTQSTSVI